MNNISLQILNEIVNNISENKILVVGIDGKGCAGKSHLASSLHNALRDLNINSTYLSIDDFCNKSEIRYGSTIHPEGQWVYYNNFDEDAFGGILKAAAENKPITYSKNHLDVRTNSFSNPISFRLTGNGVLLAEGLHLFKRKFVSYFDIKILLDISDEEQLKRALVRDIERGNSREMILYKYKHRFGPSQEFYLSKDKPFDEADYIINNNDVTNPFLIQ